jgi:hypothetical protein
MTGNYVSVRDLISVVVFLAIIAFCLYVDARRSNRDRRDGLRLLAQAEDRIEKRLEQQWSRIGREDERLRHLEETLEAGYQQKQRAIEDLLTEWAIENGATDWLDKKRNGEAPPGNPAE